MEAVKESPETSPNWGHSVNAHEAVPNQQTFQKWRDTASINVESHIKLVKLSHMCYQHKDMDTITTFFEAFVCIPADLFGH